MNQRIYLDNNASTPLDPRVCDYLFHVLPSIKGNPSSLHHEGRATRALITQARDVVSSFLGVKPREIFFTSGGSECVSTAIRGLAQRRPGGHILTSAAEHACVIETCRLLQAEGYSVDFLPPGERGAVTAEAVAGALRDNTCLIVLMSVNNETGVKTDIEAIATLARHHGIPFFVDAIAQLGKEPVVIPSGVTAMAFSGHKVQALQGVGMLFIRGGTKWQPLFVGGQQELGKRAGTENILGIASLSKAVELLQADGSKIFHRLERLRNHFESTIIKHLPQVAVNGEGSRTSNISNLWFPYVDGETFLIELDRKGIAASHGSACSSGSLEPSRVLLSMGLSLERVRSSLRFSLGRQTTDSEVDEACKIIIETYSHALCGNAYRLDV